MTGTRFIRLSGWAFVLGAIAFLPGAAGMILSVTQYAVRDWETFPLTVVAFSVFMAPLLLAVGMMGLRARYGTEIGGAGRAILLLSTALGSLLVIVGNLGQALAPVYSVSESYYFVWALGVYVLDIGLSLFGFQALVKRPLGRWNRLPLVAGLWIPILPLFFWITEPFNPSEELLVAIVIVGLVVMAIGQVLLGYILQSGLPRDPVPVPKEQVS